MRVANGGWPDPRAEGNKEPAIVPLREGYTEAVIGSPPAETRLLTERELDFILHDARCGSFENGPGTQKGQRAASLWGRLLARLRLR